MAAPAEDLSRRLRRCIVVMVPRPWQGFRQAMAEHGLAACQQPDGRPAQPGHRFYRTCYP